MRVGRHVVSWRVPRYRCFKALLNGLRQPGSRKADLFPVTPSEFDLSHITRSHARWLIQGAISDDPTPAQLRGLRPGDRLLFNPGASKTDQLALTFDDKGIVLNWHDDDLNFPRALAELELALLVRGAARKNTPMFTVDEIHAAMSQPSSTSCSARSRTKRSAPTSPTRSRCTAGVSFSRSPFARAATTPA